MPSAGRLIGRDLEREDLKRALRNRDVRWITGPTGIGKSFLVRRTLERKRIVEWTGAWMEDRGDAVACLSEALRCSPRNRGTTALGQWLLAELPRLAGCSALVLEDFHRVERTFANLFLEVLRRTRLPYAVFLLSTELWPVPGMFSNRIRHLPLRGLSADAVEQFCASYGRPSSDLPEAVRGHPYSMRLFLEGGFTSLEAWVQGLVEGLAPEDAALLDRLCLAQTRLQERWACEGCGKPSEDRLRRQGVWSGDGRGLKPVLDVAARRMEQEGRRADLEGELLQYLLARPGLPERDLRTAVTLCRKLRDEASLVALIERYAETGLSDNHLAVLQPELDRLLEGRRLPPKLKLLSFRTLTHSYEVEHYLRLHDGLLSSPEPDEALLAKLCFLKAAARTCLKDLPEPFDRYWEEAMDSPLTPDPLFSNLVQLRLHTSGISLPPGSEWEKGLLRRLHRAGVPGGAIDACGCLLGALERFWKLDLQGAIRKVEESSRLFREAGQEMNLEQNGRFLLTLYSLTDRDEDLARTLRYLESCSLNHDEPQEYCFLFRTLFETKTRWRMGDFTALERQCVGLPEYPCYLDHPLLPGPHFPDYLPFLYAVWRDRTLDSPPNGEYLRIFTGATGRLKFIASLSLGAVMIAQHFLLQSIAPADLSPLLAAMDASHPYAGRHARHLREYQRLRREADGEDLVRSTVGWLEEVLQLPESVTTPWYVLLASRLMLAGGHSARPLLRLLAASTDLERLGGHPGWIIRICSEALAGRDAPGRRDGDSEIPMSVREVVEKQLWRGIRGHEGTPASRLREDPVLVALKGSIEENWYQPLKLAREAGKLGISASGLSKRFRRAFGISPKQYQQRKKIEQARILALTTDWDLTSIAYECGFFDSAQFSRMFRSATGHSPSEFRRVQAHASTRQAGEGAQAAEQGEAGSAPETPGAPPRR